MNVFRTDKGFTLTELLVVVALIAATLAIVAPSLTQNLPKWHLNGTARDLAAKLMMARLRAIQENKPFAVVFSLGTVDKYWVESQDPVTSDWTYEGVGADAAADVNFTMESCLSNRIEFQPNGTVVTDGNIMACPVGSSASKKKLLNMETLDNRFSKFIEIQPQTGNVTIN